MPKLSPIVSEFDSTEDEEAYDVWFRAKVQASLDDKRQTIPHDEAMAQMRAVIDKARRKTGE
jgi:hypothetical protein